MTCQSSALDKAEAAWDLPVLTLYVILRPFRGGKSKTALQAWDLMVLWDIPVV